MNFKRIVSKTSITPPTSEKDKPSLEELMNEIMNLNRTIESMKVTIETKDTIIKEKEKINEELKCAHRTIRNLRQQLIDERDIYSNEKEHLYEEITRLSKKVNDGLQLHMNSGIDKLSTITVNEEFIGKEEIIYNICSKYIKIKKSKTKLHRKMDHLIQKNSQIFENILSLLEENKDCLDSLLQMLIYSSKINPSSIKYLKLLQFNAQLHFENTRLKILLTSNKIRKGEPNGFKKSKQNVDDQLMELQNQRLHYFASEKKAKWLNVNKFRSIHKKLTPHFNYDMRRSHSDTCVFLLNPILSLK